MYNILKINKLTNEKSINYYKFIRYIGKNQPNKTKK